MRCCLRRLLIAAGGTHWVVFLANHFSEFRCLCIGVRAYDSSTILELQAEECGALTVASVGESIVCLRLSSNKAAAMILTLIPPLDLPIVEHIY